MTSQHFLRQTPHRNTPECMTVLGEGEAEQKANRVAQQEFLVAVKRTIQHQLEMLNKYHLFVLNWEPSISL